MHRTACDDATISFAMPELHSKQSWSDLGFIICSWWNPEIRLTPFEWISIRRRREQRTIGRSHRKSADEAKQWRRKKSIFNAKTCANARIMENYESTAEMLSTICLSIVCISAVGVRSYERIWSSRGEKKERRKKWLAQKHNENRIKLPLHCAFEGTDGA